MKFLKLIWNNFQKFALIIGDFISSIILGIFYFIIFCTFAFFYRCFGNQKYLFSGWKIKKTQYTSINDFKNEF